MGADSAAQIMQQQSRNQVLSATLTIFDYDSIGDDNPMGTVVVTLDPMSAAPIKWYTVGKGSDANHCQNATGDLEIIVTFEGQNMRRLERGQVKNLTYYHIKVDLAWDVERG
jgi:hypothetical protein